MPRFDRLETAPLGTRSEPNRIGASMRFEHPADPFGLFRHWHPATRAHFLNCNSRVDTMLSDQSGSQHSGTSDSLAAMNSNVAPVLQKFTDIRYQSFKI